MDPPIAVPVIAGAPVALLDIAALRTMRVDIEGAIECGTRRACAIHTGLDELEANQEASLQQLSENRNLAPAALAANTAIDTFADQAEALLEFFESKSDAVMAFAAAKRTGLEVEAVAADAALEMAMRVKTELEVGAENRRTLP